MRTTSLLLLLLVAATGVTAADAPVGNAGNPEGKHRGEMLDRFDTNHDGKLDEAEKSAARTAFATRLKEKHPQLFAEVDTDHDGALSEAEMKAAHAKLKALKEHRKDKKEAPAKPAQN